MTPRHVSHGEERLAIGDAARIAGVAVETLRRWANEGKVPSQRTPGGQRRFRVADIEGLTRTMGDAAAPAEEAAAGADEEPERAARGAA